MNTASSNLSNMQNTESLKAQIRNNGYAIARNLLSSDEISNLRSALLMHFAHYGECEGLGKHQPNAAEELKGIDWIFTHPKIVAVFQDLLESQNPIFTTNCDAHMNMLSWWHKDIGKTCFSGDYFSRKECLVYRAGIYLQDQPTRGLTVRIGSHHCSDISKGKTRLLETSAGDVVFFDIRLTHAGQFPDLIEWVLLRGARYFKCEKRAMALKALYQRVLGKPEKLSIFFTYGAPSNDTDAYIAFEKASKLERTKTLKHRPSASI